MQQFYVVFAWRKCTQNFFYCGKTTFYRTVVGAVSVNYSVVWNQRTWDVFTSWLNYIVITNIKDWRGERKDRCPWCWENSETESCVLIHCYSNVDLILVSPKIKFLKVFLGYWVNKKEQNGRLDDLKPPVGAIIRGGFTTKEEGLMGVEEKP